MILVSPAEPKHIRDALTAGDARTHSLPEQYGADFLISHDGAMVGVQRKEVKDFIASVSDGRLGKELIQMRALSLGVLVVEGRVKWSDDGAMLGEWANRWTRQGWNSAMWSVNARGVWVGVTDDWRATVEYVRGLESWVRKADHQGLLQRPSATGAWGNPTNVEYVEWLLQGLPGIGAKKARDVVLELGVGVLKLGVTREELMGVKGLGKVGVDRIIAVFEDVDSGHGGD